MMRHVAEAAEMEQVVECVPVDPSYEQMVLQAVGPAEIEGLEESASGVLSPEQMMLQTAEVDELEVGSELPDYEQLSQQAVGLEKLVPEAPSHSPTTRQAPEHQEPEQLWLSCVYEASP